ncbi:MAG: hypothetical protein IKH84_03780, partial [Ottowia sp.]|nr:hypothetical protein [Ottowia sp.]
MRPTDDDDIIYSVFNAVLENDLKELKRLAASGLANAADDQEIVLIYAITREKNEAAEILLKHGADPLMPHDLGDNALHWA